MVRPPTIELISHAGEKFDKDNEVIEQALYELFRQFPANTNHGHVLLKVVTLNRLYATQIFAVTTVAEHIYNNAAEIDRGIATGSPEVVDKTGKVVIQGKTYNFFSFATKYCNWHQPDLFPIYDSNVESYLWSLQKQECFTKNKFKRKALWQFPDFVEIMKSFRDHYGLQQFSFKEIDKFLWQEGAPVGNGPEAVSGIDEAHQLQ